MRQTTGKMQEEIRRLQKIYREKKELFEKREALLHTREEHERKGKSCRDLDAEIDALEEVTAECLTKTADELKTALKATPLGPQLRLKEQALQELLEKRIAHENEKKAFATFFAHLERGRTALASTSRFQFLLGRHPKVLLAQHLHEASQAAAILSPAHPALKATLTQFLKETHKKWNTPLYGPLFHEFWERFAFHRERYEEELGVLEGEIGRIAIEIEEILL